MATLQLKRGTAARWIELNPVLAVGEPGFEYDTQKLKIGDGVSTWINLPYQGEGSIVNANTRYDFPSIGKVNVIYKAESEKMIYQWNPIDLKYEALNVATSSESLEIKIINGGNANE